MFSDTKCILKAHQWQNQKNCVGGVEGENALLRGRQKSKNCQEWLIVSPFFLGGGGGEDLQMGVQSPRGAAAAVAFVVR